MNDFSAESRWVGSLLDAAAERHRAIASNLANASTKGYRPVRVKFEEVLRNLLAKNRGRVDYDQLATARPVVEIAPERGVAIEEELMGLMKNQLAYDTYAQVLSMKANLLRAAIRGGRG
jgi:flagellar basal-body rod protein FlgB